MRLIATFILAMAVFMVGGQSQAYAFLKTAIIARAVNNETKEEHSSAINNLEKVLIASTNVIIALENENIVINERIDAIYEFTIVAKLPQLTERLDEVWQKLQQTEAKSRDAREEVKRMKCELERLLLEIGKDKP